LEDWAWDLCAFKGLGDFLKWVYSRRKRKVFILKWLNGLVRPKGIFWRLFGGRFGDLGQLEGLPNSFFSGIFYKFFLKPFKKGPFPRCEVHVS